MAAAATSSSPNSLATASGLLLATLLACMGVGTLVGWALGNGGYGLLAGAVAGIPAAIAVVIRIYGRAT